MQMRRPYAHFKHGQLPSSRAPPLALSHTHSRTIHVSQSGGLLRWQWVSVMPTRCKTFQLQAKSWAVWYLLKEHLQQKSLQPNYCLPLRIDISYTYVLCASISLFILTLNLEYGNKGDDDYKGYPAVQGGEKKKERKHRGNASAVLHKRYTMCPC